MANYMVLPFPLAPVCTHVNSFKIKKKIESHLLLQGDGELCDRTYNGEATTTDLPFTSGVYRLTSGITNLSVFYFFDQSV